jgi:hypothetical protein
VYNVVDETVTLCARVGGILSKKSTSNQFIRLISERERASLGS